MPESTRRRELARGERVLPGVWRLRLPLPWPGVPHCNAWALAAGDGIVLVDTGTHEPGSLAGLERALGQVNLRLEHVRLLVCTHAHADHCGQAAPIVARAGCELWMHPHNAHGLAGLDDPERALERRVEVALQSGVPEGPLRAWAESRRAEAPLIAAPVVVDRELVEGVEVATDLGTWRVIETPGHAPSHVCLFQPERRILISGDHLLGRVSLYFDHGYTPDPVGEFLHSLGRVEELEPRLCLAGHARPFTSVAEHILANRELVAERLAAVLGALAGGPLSAYEITAAARPDISPATAGWFLLETLCHLTHLEHRARVARVAGPDGTERWEAPR